MKKSTTRQTSMFATIAIIAIALVNTHSASAQMDRNTLSAESRAAIESLRKESIEPTRFIVDEGLRQVTRARFDIWAPAVYSTETQFITGELCRIRYNQLSFGLEMPFIWAMRFLYMTSGWPKTRLQTSAH